jgi:hypothetical protein
MSNLEAELQIEKVSASFQSYAQTGTDVAYTSEILNLRIAKATSMNISYKKPNDGQPVFVKIWKGLIIDISQTPIFTQKLNAYEGEIDVATPEINLLKGEYVVAITSDDNRVIASTQTIFNGQNLQAGSSSLFVIAKNIDSVNVVFNMPANVIGGSQTLTWVILKEGDVLGKGNLIANQTTTPDTSSGLVQVSFPKGKLVEGKKYNVALNPGGNTQYITAGYVFQYVVQ